MPEFSGEERRRFVRVSADLAVRIRLGESVVSYPAAFARDISTGGLGVEIAGEYPDSYDKLKSWKGQVEVEMDLPSGQKLVVPAAVAWGRLEEVEGKKKFRVGLKFLELDERSRRLLSELVKAKVDEMYRARAAERERASTQGSGGVGPSGY